MPQTASGTSAATRAEVAVFAGALTVWTVALLWLTDWVLITRPLWVDECFTVLVASRQWPWQVVADLYHGADGGASLFHILMWVVRGVSGPLRPVNLHIASVVLMLGALVVLYAVLRRRFSRDVSAAGALAAGSHSIVVAMSYEGRFYALWLFCCAMVAWFLGAAPSRKRNVWLAVASVLLVTGHWYGVVTLGVMAGFVFVTSRGLLSERVRNLLPVAAGFVAFAAIWPLAQGQKAVLTVASWVPSFTTGQLKGLLDGFWFASVPVAAAIVIVGAIGMLSRAGKANEIVSMFAPLRDPGLAALFALASMPFVLSAMSLVGQPSMLGRYALPAALAWAPWVALAAARFRSWMPRVAMLGLAWLWYSGYVHEADNKRKNAIGIAQEATALSQAESMGLPVVFTSTHTLYPQAIYRRLAGDASALLDLPDSTLDKFMAPTMRWYELNKGVRLDRDFARVHAKLYGFPALATQAALDSTPKFVIVSNGSLYPRGVTSLEDYWRLVFPRHRFTPLGEMTLVFERDDARNLPARSTSRSGSRK